MQFKTILATFLASAALSSASMLSCPLLLEPFNLEPANKGYAQLMMCCNAANKYLDHSSTYTTEQFLDDSGVACFRCLNMMIEKCLPSTVDVLGCGVSFLGCMQEHGTDRDVEQDPSVLDGIVPGAGAAAGLLPDGVVPGAGAGLLPGGLGL